MEEEQKDVTQESEEVKESLFDFDEIKETKGGERTESKKVQGLTVINYGTGEYIIEFNDIPFGKIDGQGNYTYFNLENAKKAFKDAGLDMKEIDLPELQQAIDLEEQAKKEQEDNQVEEEKETEGSEEQELEQEPEQEDDEEIVDEEKDDEKPDLEEEEEKKPEKSEVKRDSSWIEIRSDREIDEMRTFAGAIKKEHPELGEISRTFIAPDKNNGNSYKLYVQSKQGKLIEVPLEQTEGENPMHESVTTIQNDGSNATKKTPIQILKINNRNMIMIFNGGSTTTSVHIANRTDGDNYTSTEISSIDSQNELNDSTEGVKNQVSSSYGQLSEGDEQERAYATIKNFEKQDVPEEIDPSKDGAGIEAQEMDDFPTAIFEALKESLKQAMEDKNINVSKEAIEEMATSIIEGKDFEDAVIDGMRVEEQAGRIPPDSAERVGENISDSLTNDEPVEEEEREEDPRLRGKR